MANTGMMSNIFSLLFEISELESNNEIAVNCYIFANAIRVYMPGAIEYFERVSQYMRPFYTSQRWNFNGMVFGLLEIKLTLTKIFSGQQLALWNKH